MMDNDLMKGVRVALLCLIISPILWFFTRSPVASLVAWLSGMATWLGYCMFMGEAMERRGMRQSRPVWGLIGLCGEALLIAGWWCWWYSASPVKP